MVRTRNEQGSRGLAARRAEGHAQAGVAAFALAALLSLALLLVASTPASARTTGSYPRLANIYFPSLHDADLERLARYDVLVLPARGEELTREELATLRELNPGITLLAHMPIGYHGDWESPSIFSDVMDAAFANDWWLRDRVGQRVQLGCGDYLLNLTVWCPTDDEGRTFSEWMAMHIAERLAPGGLWDGVFLDYCMDDISWVGNSVPWGLDADRNAQADDPAELDEAWREGTRRLVSNLREYVGPDYILMTNGNNTFYEYCDGGTREDFPNMHGEWYENVTAPEYGYTAIESHYREPTVNIINTIWHSDADPDADMPHPLAEQKLRYTLATTLVYGDGYYSFDGGSGLRDHSQTWWHELYELDLGTPLERGALLDAWPGSSPWIENGEMVAMRRFTRGVVVVNPSTCTQRVDLGGMYYPSDSWNGSFYPYDGSRSTSEMGYCSGDFYVGRGSVLSAVVDVSFKRGDDGHLLLAWNDVPGAVAYAVYRNDGQRAAGTGELVAVVDGTQFRDEGQGRESAGYRVAPIDELLCEGRPSLEVSAPSACFGEFAEASMAAPPGERGGAFEGIDATRYDGLRNTPADVRTGAPAVSGALHGCSPNPASTETGISFTLGDDERWSGGRPTTVALYDVSGRLVRTLENDRLPAGRHEVRWNLRDDSGRRVAAGCYLVAVTTGEETLRGKLLVIN